MIPCLQAPGCPDSQHPLGPLSHSDGALIRGAATRLDIPLLTTLSAAAAAVEAIRALPQRAFSYRSLQAHYAAK